MKRKTPTIPAIDIETSETYGKLIEGLHLTGYSFERAMGNIVKMLKEDRWRMGGRFDDPNAFLDTLRFTNLRLIADQRREFVRIMKEIAPEVSNRQVAKTLGVTSKTVDRDVASNDADGGKKTNQNKGQKSGRASNDASPAISGERAAKLVAKRETGGQDRREKVAEDEKRVLQLQPIAGKFRTLVLDPAWEYSWLSLAGRAKPGYAMQSIEQLMQLNVQAWADDKSGTHLYLWTTNNFMAEACKLVAHWGFQHRVLLTWIKPPPFGLGSYFRNSTEHCLFATFGETTTRPAAASIPTHFEAPRGEHSEKPDKFYDIVRAASYPPYGEGNQRAPRQDFVNLYCPTTDASEEQVREIEVAG